MPCIFWESVCLWLCGSVSRSMWVCRFVVFCECLGMYVWGYVGLQCVGAFAGLRVFRICGSAMVCWFVIQCVSIDMSICSSIRLTAWQSDGLLVYQSVSLSFFWSVFQHIHVSAFISFCPSANRLTDWPNNGMHNAGFESVSPSVCRNVNMSLLAVSPRHACGWKRVNF